MRGFGIGCDIEQIYRFREMSDLSSNFYCHTFSQNEREYCDSQSDPFPHYAARFCGKESVIKALSSIGVNGINFSSIEITRDEHGMPNVHISHDIDKERIPDNLVIHISLSHCDEYAMAMALIFLDENHV